MQDGEALVEKNEIVVEKGEKLSSSLKYELSTLARQQENGSFLFFPREWLYFNAKDTSRFFGRWIQEKLAEPPTVFSRYATEESAKSMRNYLISKGYYSAAVAYEPKFNKDSSRVDIAYQIDPNRLYVIDTVNIVSQDKTIETVLNDPERQSLLKKGEAVSLDIYNNEVTRIVTYLKNNGYATFNRGFIAPLQADSTDNRINLTLEILPKSDSTNHKSYLVGEIHVFPDYDPLDSIVVVDGEPPIYQPENRINYVKDTLINGIRFFQPNWKNAIKAKHLAREIRLRSGEKYSLSRENQTNNSLNTLGVFRFVSIRSEIDSLQDTILHYKIYLTRNKRLGFGSNLEFSYSDQNITRNRINLVGATASLSLKLRNAFKGAELFTNSVSFGMEFEPDAPPVLNTIDFSIQSQLNIPRFMDYFGFWKWIGRKKKEDGLFNFLDQNASTQYVLGYNFLTRRNFYNYELFDFAVGYNAQLGGRHQLQLNHLGVNYFNPSFEKGSDFEILLDNNPFLSNSFGQQFFTGVLLKEVNYLYNFRNIRKGQQYSFSARLELSGVEVQAANSIYNRFALEETTFTVGMIDFSRYGLLELDGRFTKTFNPLQSLALRFNFGLGLPFGLTEELPYVKQFFIGGPNSIRAFRAREVGPGAHCSPDVFSLICPSDGVDALDEDTPFYQTGNLKLEFNAEYRFDMLKIFSYTIEGALFAEAGNVWLTELNEEDIRTNGLFRFTPQRDESGVVINEAFYKQLALGTGFGVRLDLQYFLLRLDMGYPLHTPYEPREAWVQQFTFEDVNYNLALNYPF